MKEKRQMLDLLSLYSRSEAVFSLCSNFLRIKKLKL